MESKRLVWLFSGIGGFIGGYIPLLWGDEYFSFASVFCTAIGGIIGIWIAFKMTH